MSDTVPRPTHDLMAEKAAITKLTQGSVEIANILTQEDFFDPVNRDIFIEAKEIFKKYGECDLVMLCHNLEGNTRIQAVGGSTYILKMVNESSFLYHVATVIPLIEILKNMRVLRERKGTAIEMGKHPPKDLPKFLVDEGKRYAELIPKKSVIDIDELLSELTMTEDTISTGFLSMDMLLDGGLQDGMVFVIAAMSSAGKTSLATTIMANLLTKGHEVHYISLEMSRKHIVSRVLCAMSNSTPKEVKADAKELLECIKTPFNITGESNGLADIEAEVLSTPAKVVIIDYMDLMVIKGREGRMIQLDEISRSIKSLARHSNKPIILVRQLNRDMYKSKENREPQLSDLFGAGEKDADVISFLWDPNAKTTEDSNAEDTARALDGAKRTLKWIVRKNRNGPTGSMELLFDAERFTMREVMY